MYSFSVLQTRVLSLHFSKRGVCSLQNILLLVTHVPCQDIQHRINLLASGLDKMINFIGEINDLTVSVQYSI